MKHNFYFTITTAKRDAREGKREGVSPMINPFPQLPKCLEQCKKTFLMKFSLRSYILCWRDRHLCQHHSWFL